MTGSAPAALDVSLDCGSSLGRRVREEGKGARVAAAGGLADDGKRPCGAGRFIGLR